MKKKGFTLIELVAVMTIASVVVILIGGIYVSGVKKIRDSKASNDMENKYRNTYKLITNKVKNSYEVMSLKNDKESKVLGKRFRINKGLNKPQGFKEDKAYILTKDINSDVDTILATFKKDDGSDELNLYILYVDKDQVKESETRLDLENISNLEFVCDSIKGINITEVDNGFNFKLIYLKDNIKKDFEFYISKNTKSKILEIEDNIVKNDEELESNIELLKTNIAALTVLNPKKDSKYINIGTRIKVVNISFFFPKISKESYNGDVNKQFISGIDNGGGAYPKLGAGITNMNDDGNTIKSFMFNLKKEDVYLDVKDIMKDIPKDKCILLIKKPNTSNYIQEIVGLNEDIKEDRLKDCVGVIIGEGYDKEGKEKIIILTNGNLTIHSPSYAHQLSSKKSYNYLIYSNGKITLDTSVYLNNSSLVAGEGINVNQQLVLYGRYDVTDKTKKWIKKFWDNNENQSDKLY